MKPVADCVRGGGYMVDGGDVGSMMRVERTRWRMDIAQSREARRNWPEGLEVDE